MVKFMVHGKKERKRRRIIIIIIRNGAKTTSLQTLFGRLNYSVDVWYLGTNQNGIIFELLTANSYKNQRTHPTCIV